MRQQAGACQQPKQHRIRDPQAASLGENTRFLKR